MTPSVNISFPTGKLKSHLRKVVNIAICKKYFFSFRRFLYDAQLLQRDLGGGLGNADNLTCANP